MKLIISVVAFSCITYFCHVIFWSISPTEKSNWLFFFIWFFQSFLMDLKYLPYDFFNYNVKYLIQQTQLVSSN